MRVYVGSTRSSEFIRVLKNKDVGRVNHPLSIFTPYSENEKWFADNGAYSTWLKQEPFNEPIFLKYLDRLDKLDRKPRFGVVPDIVADGMRSLDFSLDWTGRNILPDWPWYLAVQDGMGIPDVEQVLDMFAGIFIGGTIKFKSHAAGWVQLGDRHGKPVHFGRAGIHHRIQFAYETGCDSCDSAFPLWTKERFETFMSWIKDGHYDPESYKQEGLFSV